MTDWVKLTRKDAALLQDWLDDLDAHGVAVNKTLASINETLASLGEQIASVERRVAAFEALSNSPPVPLEESK